MLQGSLLRTGVLPRRLIALGLVLLQAAVAGELLADPGCAEHQAGHPPEIVEAASPAQHHAGQHHGHTHADSHGEAHESQAPTRPDRHGDHEACICVGVCHAASPAALPSPGDKAGVDPVSRGPLGAGSGTGIIPISPAFLLPFATAPPPSR